MGSFFRQAVCLAALALLPAAGEAIYFRERVSWRQPAPSDEVNLAQADGFAAQVMWIDARPREQFEAKHVPGAFLLNAGEWDELLPAMLNAWTPDRKLVVYCSAQSCDASKEVARRLKEEAGLKNVYVLTGGWEAWQSGHYAH
ncbi:MAG: rhodanese-like domain-containing protein [Verrucomicrobiota bacterium]